MLWTITVTDLGLLSSVTALTEHTLHGHPVVRPLPGLQQTRQAPKGHHRAGKSWPVWEWGSCPSSLSQEEPARGQGESGARKLCSTPQKSSTAWRGLRASWLVTPMTWSAVGAIMWEAQAVPKTPGILWEQADGLQSGLSRKCLIGVQDTLGIQQ